MTRTEGPNPDELLVALKKEDIQQKRGTLKVFLGMCAGVDRTCSMLEWMSTPRSTFSISKAGPTLDEMSSPR